jgi:ABC-type polysaccharide transport system permease subunit
VGTVSVDEASAQRAAQASAGDRWRIWRWRHRHTLVAAAILTPILLYFVIFTWVPILVMATISLTEWNIIQWPPEFVGVENYVHIFTDPYYHRVIGNTVLFGLIVLILNMVVGFSVAMLLNESIKSRACRSSSPAPSSPRRWPSSSTRARPASSTVCSACSASRR